MTSHRPLDDPGVPPPATSPFLGGVTAYHVPRASAPVDLHLDGNEGAAPPAALLSQLAALDPESIRRYPSTDALTERLAQRVGVDPAHVLVTAGGDDAIDRACRAYLAPGRSLLVHAPSFEMIARGARLVGADVDEVDWLDGPFPLDAFLQAITPRTAMIALVTPNNPTGLTIPVEAILAVRAAAPDAVLLIDLAYTEFADEDLTARVLELPNVIAVRTLSKAFGLAGARVGYAVARREIISALRAAGGPYTVSAPSLALACHRLDEGQEDVDASLTTVRRARSAVQSLLKDLDVPTTESAANFVLARVPDSIWMRDALAGLGIAIRAFPSRPHLDDAVRITLPTNEPDLERLLHALSAVLRPQAVLFDLDGVLAGVGGSFRECIVRTAATYGVAVSTETIRNAKAAGDANNDWVLTHRLVTAAGVDATLEEITQRFQSFYMGDETTPGLCETETLLVARAWIHDLAKRYPLAIVTGRPRADAEYFLRLHGLHEAFHTVVTMEDGPAKPDPTVVQLAMEQLGVTRAWMIGDTPDDMRAARASSVVPVGILAPQDDADFARSLTAAGAGRVLSTINQLSELLP